MLIDLLLALWLSAVTGYLVWSRPQAARPDGAKVQRLDRLRARRPDLALLLTQMQSKDPATRVAAAREAIRRRAGAP